jgi:hypothetical protein
MTRRASKHPGALRWSGVIASPVRERVRAADKKGEEDGE